MRYPRPPAHIFERISADIAEYKEDRRQYMAEGGSEEYARMFESVFDSLRYDGQLRPEVPVVDPEPRDQANESQVVELIRAVRAHRHRRRKSGTLDSSVPLDHEVLRRIRAEFGDGPLTYDRTWALVQKITEEDIEPRLPVGFVDAGPAHDPHDYRDDGLVRTPQPPRKTHMRRLRAFLGV